MNAGLRDLAGHHVWATDLLLSFCGGLDEAALGTTVPGTYGTMIDTLRHMIDAEMSYLFRLTGAWPERPWQAGETVGIDVLRERAGVLGGVLTAFVASDWDEDRLGEARGGRSEVYAVPAGVFLAQLFHHANEHRAHVCTIIGALGLEAPDVSAWGYSIETGRATLKNAAPE